MSPSLPGLLNEVVALAEEAGEAILAIYRRGEARVTAKGDHSPLTEADLASHAIIASGLGRLAPGIPVLSEEDTAGFPGPSPEGCHWLVDPLDGTKEFLARNGEFTVNIALVERGVPVLGVVHVPAQGRCYSAARGMGAFLQQGGGRPEPIRTRQHLKATPWRVVGSRSHAGDSLGDFLRALGPHELVSVGSSLKFCLVAQGEADLYPRFGPTHHWDTAAAQCVLEQAGGQVCDLAGNPLRYETGKGTLNPPFLAQVGGSPCERPFPVLVEPGPGCV